MAELFAHSGECAAPPLQCRFTDALCLPRPDQRSGAQRQASVFTEATSAVYLQDGPALRDQTVASESLTTER